MLFIKIKKCYSKTKNIEKGKYDFIYLKFVI
jgi:hypothetical protein